MSFDTQQSRLQKNDRDEWFKNLSKASFVQGKWTHASSENIQALATSQIQDVMTEVEKFAVTGAEAFNWNASPARYIRVLHLTPPRDNPSMSGIVLLQQGTQLRVEYRPFRIDAALIAHFGFERETKPIRSLLPQVDAHGGVFWMDQYDQSYTVEMMVRTLFCDLVQANFEIQALNFDSSNLTDQHILNENAKR